MPGAADANVRAVVGRAVDARVAVVDAFAHGEIPAAGHRLLFGVKDHEEPAIWSSCTASSGTAAQSEPPQHDGGYSQPLGASCARVLEESMSQTATHSA